MRLQGGVATPQKQNTMRESKKRAGSERPKWRDARSELVANNAPAQAEPRDTNDQPVATADTPPIRIAPVRRVSVFQDWSERWVDIEQIVAAPPIKATSPPIAAPASEQNTDLGLVVRGLALFMFGFGIGTDLCHAYDALQMLIRPVPPQRTARPILSVSLSLLTLTRIRIRCELTATSSELNCSGPLRYRRLSLSAGAG